MIVNGVPPAINDVCLNTPFTYTFVFTSKNLQFASVYSLLSNVIVYCIGGVTDGVTLGVSVGVGVTDTPGIVEAAGVSLILGVGVTLGVSVGVGVTEAAGEAAGLELTLILGVAVTDGVTDGVTVGVILGVTLGVTLGEGEAIGVQY